MTDEERKKLVTDLKAARPGYPPGELCLKAADEIERLADDRMNAGYQRDQALIELNRLAERVEQLEEQLWERIELLEAQVTALSRM